MSTVDPTVATGPVTWTVDPAHTHVEFAVRHMMLATVKGRFAALTGTIVLDEAEASKSTVEVSVDVASIDTREAQRDAHLRSADFFDVENFPKMTFRSTRIERAADGRYKVAGDLTIRNQARPIVLEVTAEGRGKDPWGGQRAGFTASAKITRSDFGLTWNQALETGGVLVGDEVKISIDAELLKQA